jgi:hypothetical protein
MRVEEFLVASRLHPEAHRIESGHAPLPVMTADDAQRASARARVRGCLRSCPRKRASSA